MRYLTILGITAITHSTLLFAQQNEPQKDAIPRSVKDVRVLSPEWICAVVDPTEEILAIRQAQFGDDLAADKAAAATLEQEGKQAWYLQFSKTYHTLMVQNSYHLPLFAKLNEPNFWKVNNKAPADITVWAHAIDGFPGWEAADMPTADTGAYCRTADMVYLKLPETLKNGEKIEVKGEDGRGGTFTFNDESTPCWSIKVNQSAYASSATKKAAFLGMWLPGIGALDFAAFNGKPFTIKKFEKGTRWDQGTATGTPVFTGEIKLRKKFDDQDVKREGGSNLTGEDVYELDFSAFTGEGTYCIQIPGLGRSWPFEVSKHGYGDAFYNIMKGLYIQRCGIELKKPFSAWERPECHTETKVGDFIPETNTWYANKYRQKAPNQDTVGFRTATGNRTAVEQFTLIKNANPDAPIMEGVKGGWHDAADFDRRYYHYTVVWDLLAAFEAFPANFKDSQLNIPESGNGIPDILDEAAWGIDVWKKTQLPSGAVSSWIEQPSHPGAVPNNLNKAFAENKLPFFSSEPDRTGSYAYAAAAACLGRLLAPYAPERSKEYIESAKRAFAWANEESNAMKNKQFTLETTVPGDNKLKGTTIRFDEDPILNATDPGFWDAGLAAANLYFATKNSEYLTAWETSEFGKKYAFASASVHASKCMPLVLNPGLPEEDVARIKTALLAEADKLLKSQEDNPYRMPWLSPEEGWFHATAWGNVHSKARLLALAYAINHDAKYKAALENAADFFLGCNPNGSTLVTGIGSVSPVVIQHIHSLSDGIAEPTPGIAPYTFTFDIPLTPFLIVDKGHPSVKKFYTPVAMAFIPDKLGRKEIQANLDAMEKSPDSSDWIQTALKDGKAIIWKNTPVFRRKVTHPIAVVPKNEFTINETMSPLALLFGVLTTDNWMPSEELKNREPKKSIDDLPIYSMP